MNFSGSKLELALIENIQRENLNPLEEAQGIKRLIDEFSMTHEKAAEAVGRSTLSLPLSPHLSDDDVTDVIEPEMTRPMLSLALRKLLSKRELRRCGRGCQNRRRRL